MFAGWQPVALGGWVDLEDMSSGAEDGLFPSEKRHKMAKVREKVSKKLQVILYHIKKTQNSTFTDEFTNTMAQMRGCGYG